MKETAAGQIRACTISCHLDRFHDVVAAMEANFGPFWTDLAPDTAPAFLQTRNVELAVLCLSCLAEPPEILERIVQLARRQGARIVVVGHDVGPAVTQRLIQLECEMVLANGPSVPDIAAALASERCRRPARVWDGPSKVVAVTGLAAGCGATMLARGLAQEMRRLPSTPQTRLVQPADIRHDDADIHVVDLPPDAVTALRDVMPDRLRWLVIASASAALPDLPVLPLTLRNRVSPLWARLSNLRHIRALPEAGPEGLAALSGGLPLAEIAARDRLRLSIRALALQLVRTM